MKKRQQRGQGLTIQFLQKKYQDEKILLMKENKKLSQQLLAEIQRSNQLAFNIEKIQQTQKHRYQQIQRQNQVYRAKILELQKQDQSISIHEEQQLQNLNEQKRLIIQNQALLTQKLELEHIIQKIYQQKTRLQNDIQTMNQNQAQIQQQMQTLAARHEQYKRQCQKQIDELIQTNKSILEEKQKEAQRYNEQRKKKKQLQKKVVELQKMSQNIKYEDKRLEQQFQEIRNQKNREHQKNVEANTKLSLCQSKIINLQNYISKLEDQSKQNQKKLSVEKELTQQLKYKLQKIEQEMIKTHQQKQNLKQLIKDLEMQIQKSTIKKQQLIKAMRRNQTQQLIGVIKSGCSQSQKQLSKYGEGSTIKQGNSQSDIVSLNRPFVHVEQRPMEKAKLQLQINSLQNQLNHYRKQVDSLNYQINKFKRVNEDKTLELQRKDSEIREYRLKYDKLQNQRNRQLINLRNENQNLKSRQTERLEKAKQFQEYQTAMSLKLAFYERKIKEHLQSLDRKQSIIQKLQMQRNEMEDKQKIEQQSYRRLSDQVQFLRKFKQDCNRKDDLLKQYKIKLQKLKIQTEDIRGQLTQMKKDKQRLERNIESKDQYLATLKSKQQKQSIDKTEDTGKENKLKQLKNSYELKLRVLRKQKEQLIQSLKQIRNAVMNRVQQICAKQIPVNKKKTQQYEAAKLLGIKPGQLDEFLNPGNAITKRIGNELQDLWLQEHYGQFVEKFISFISQFQVNSIKSQSKNC